MGVGSIAEAVAWSRARGLRVRALSVDAGGALLHPAAPVAETYAAAARARGHAVEAAAVGARFPAAMAAHRGRGGPDGRGFWRAVVADAVGAEVPGLFEALYAHYAAAEAWTVAPGAAEALRDARAAGVQTALLSNWDTRLRPLIAALGLADAFDVVCVSAEIGAEKPAAAAFAAVVDALGRRPGEVLHLGDDRRADVAGAREAGLAAACWTGADPPLAAVVGVLVRALHAADRGATRPGRGSGGPAGRGRR
jgi:REG-2-like HAD superfamily hydrolase